MTQRLGRAEALLPLRFDRNELAGAFGDLGTDLPLIALLVLTCRLDARSVLILFGACQVFSGLAYRLPIPVQPLKAMAAIAISQGLSGEVLAGGGLAIGAVMLVLSLTGGLGLIARIVPTVVVRGLQFGLGLKLALLAVGRYVPDGGTHGYVLAGIAFLIILLLRGNRRFPAALFVLALGFFYVFALDDGWARIEPRLAPGLPTVVVPSLQNLMTGLVVLAIPQLPLSLGNAVLATRQTVSDLFPGQQVSVRKLGLTYSVCNLVAPVLGGIPVCHGSGGVAGHYAFGARTGGAPVIYGMTFLVAGLLLGPSFLRLIEIFPLSLLGMLLLFEALPLMGLARHVAGDPHDFFLVLLVGVLAAGLPYGFCVGVVVGLAVHYGRVLWERWRNGRVVPQAAGDASSNEKKEAHNG